MVTYVLPPGAWLSGSDLHPAVGGNAPLHPAVGGNAPLQPPIKKRRRGHLSVSVDPEEMDSPESQLADAAQRLTVASPWHGGDSPWAYRGTGDALMSAALNRVRSRLVREIDPRTEGGDNGRIRLPVGFGGSEDALWRWGDEFRNQAVLSDLNWRFAVEGRCLWYLNRSTQDGLEVRFAQSMLIEPMLGDQDPYVWYDEQADKVLRAAVQREDRLPEILAQAEDIMPFFFNLTGLDPESAPVTANLLTVAQLWATPLIMAMKHQVAMLRPYMVSSRIVPAIETPTHGSMPSGHATVSSMVSALLRSLLYGDTLKMRKGNPHSKVLQIDRLARRIAFNRVVAGVHFPMDSTAGYALGLQMAAHLVSLAIGSGQQPARFDPFDEANLKGRVDIGLREGSTPRVPSIYVRTQGLPVAVSEPWQQMWTAACAELQRLGLRQGDRP